MVCYVRPALRRRLASALVVVAIAGCGPAATASPASTPVASPSAELASSSPADGETVVLVGRIVTMGHPPVAEALLIDEGKVTAVGTGRGAGPRRGHDAEHRHRRERRLPGVHRRPRSLDRGPRYYDIETPAEAMDAAITRGWTSISEQWVNPERLVELTALAEEDALPLRVDAYLALNYDREFLGDWYTAREAPSTTTSAPRG